jgi:hypothetical protein
MLSETEVRNEVEIMMMELGDDGNLKFENVMARVE